MEVSNPQWLASFPHLITPREDEWLPGFLMRCDCVNSWSSGTTLRMVYELAGKQVVFAGLKFCAPTGFPYAELGTYLALSPETLYATTYMPELRRLFPASTIYTSRLGPLPQHICRVCPLCIQSSMLHRSLILPGLALCPIHHIFVQDHCHCKTPIHFFTASIYPWHCDQCLYPWADLPIIEGQEEQRTFEQHLFFLYHYFFSQGTLSMLETIWREIRHWMAHRQFDDLPLPDGNSLSYGFTHPITTFSLHRIALALLAIRDKEPHWFEEHGFAKIWPH